MKKILYWMGIVYFSMIAYPLFVVCGYLFAIYLRYERRLNFAEVAPIGYLGIFITIIVHIALGTLFLKSYREKNKTSYKFFLIILCIYTPIALLTFPMAALASHFVGFFGIIILGLPFILYPIALIISHRYREVCQDERHITP